VRYGLAAADVNGLVYALNGDAAENCPTATAAQANPNQVATLRWYPAITGLSFPVAAIPYGIAFDGSNIWVASCSGYPSC